MSEKLYGYAGSILRVNLTDRSTEIIPSSKYLPDYIGGRALCNKIFWDEVGAGVGAFDPENKLIFAVGPTTGTGLPTGGRAVMCSIAPNSLPEQYASASIGGYVGTMMKYAGYDALIVEGKSDKPVYLLIDDDKISIKDASPIWGMLISDAQEAIKLAHGKDVCSMAIGPAGEHLCRNATVTTNNDNTLAKSGFGAVFGSKNLKAIAFHGTGDVTPADIDKLFELRLTIGKPEYSRNKVNSINEYDTGWVKVGVPEGTLQSKLACSNGCNSRCNAIFMNLPSVINGEPCTQTEKCASTAAYGMKNDLSFPVGAWCVSEKNDTSVGETFSWGPKPADDSDPDFDIVSKVCPGDLVNFHEPSFSRGELQNVLCKEYGLDKYDFDMWYMPWISMCKQEGLLDELDFGMEPDPDSEEFVRHFFDSIVYRRGIGDIFAEGMARATRILGEKFRTTTYKNRFTADGKTQLDLPVSLEIGWGQMSHWHGRGFTGCQKWFWTGNSLCSMVNTRDVQSSGHVHVTSDEIKVINEEGPCYSQTLIDRVIWTENTAILKDSIIGCEFQAANIFWPTMEAELYNAATGLNLTPEELIAKCERSRMIFRAILMRNYGRTRDMEVEEVYPFLTYPDPQGEVVDWEEWNHAANMYYQTNGWDMTTGWPTRSCWEKHGLKDIADEMEKLGKLPKENQPFTLKESPFDGHVRKQA